MVTTPKYAILTPNRLLKDIGRRSSYYLYVVRAYIERNREIRHLQVGYLQF